LLRTAAERLIRTTDLNLSERVCSYRLNFSPDKPAYWTFVDRKRSYEAFIDRALTILRKPALRCMCRTDVASFYASVGIDILEELLARIGCEKRAASFLIGAINHWQSDSDLRGLPIGPEASAVAGNLFLSPVDKALSSARLSHLRYGDDILVFCEEPSICDAVPHFLDIEFNRLHLSRSEPKTRKFYDPEEAAADLRDGRLASLGSFLRYQPEEGPRALHRAFDRDVIGQEVKPNVFRWIVNTLKNKADRYGCRALANDRELMNVDPRVGADYVILARSDDRVIEGCMECLLRSPEQRYEGLSLHLLRALSTSALGCSEGDTLEEIACDCNRPWPVRAWAWTAHAKTAARRDGKLMEAARAEREPNVRRAIVATLITSQKGRRQREFIEHARLHFPESRFTAEWLNAA
jgi:hypothetical protein